MISSISTKHFKKLLSADVILIVAALSATVVGGLFLSHVIGPINHELIRNLVSYSFLAGGGTILFLESIFGSYRFYRCFSARESPVDETVEPAHFGSSQAVPEDQVKHNEDTEQTPLAIDEAGEHDKDEQVPTSTHDTKEKSERPEPQTSLQYEEIGTDLGRRHSMISAKEQVKHNEDAEQKPLTIDEAGEHDKDEQVPTPTHDTKEKSEKPEPEISLQYENMRQFSGFNTYKMKQMERNGFIYFWLRENAEHGDKFHISIEREKENLKKAFQIIFQILYRHQIHSFKILPIEEIEKKDNSVGKEFVIYIQTRDAQEGKIEFWRDLVLKEIVENLKNEKIRPGSHPSGDIAIKGGHGFIYSRSSFNIFGQYVDASFLKQTGFSYEEAQISPSKWLDLVIGEKDEHNDVTTAKVTKIFFPKKINEIKSDEQNTERILKTFCEDIGAKRTIFMRGRSYRLPKLLFMIIGTLSDGVVGRKNDFYQEASLIYCLFDLRNKPRELNFNGLVLSELDLNTEFFESYLRKSAQLVDYLEKKYNLRSETVGNIFPAIYFYLIVPLAQKKRDNLDLELTEAEEEKLIQEIALCAFRERKEFPDRVTLNQLAEKSEGA